MSARGGRGADGGAGLGTTVLAGAEEPVLGALPALLALVTLLALAATDAAGQRVPAGGAVLVGTVLADSAGRTPIAGARVLVEGTGLEVSSGEAGAFTVTGIPAGTHPVRVRHPGFHAAGATLRFAGADTVVYRVVLVPLAQRLPATVVEAPVDRRLEELELRRRMGAPGVYLRRQELGQAVGRPLTSALVGRPGLRVVTANGRSYLANARGGHLTSVDAGGKPAMQGGRGAPRNEAAPCLMTMLLDGVPVGEVNLDNVRADDVEAVEIYRGSAEIPERYRAIGTACGVAVIWRRIR